MRRRACAPEHARTQVTPPKMQRKTCVMRAAVAASSAAAGLVRSAAGVKHRGGRVSEG